MRIERTNDLATIKNIMTNHAVYPYISDDGTPEPEHFNPIIDDQLYYLLVVEEGLIHGLYLLHPINYITYEIHTCLLPSCRGDTANEAAQAVLGWIFNNTECLKIVTHVPENNKPALAYAKRAGLVEEGINRKSFLKNGKLYNQRLLGITREESCQLQHKL